MANGKIENIWLTKKGLKKNKNAKTRKPENNLKYVKRK